MLGVFMGCLLMEGILFAQYILEKFRFLIKNL